PTHATGTPGGIWTMESKASSPSSTLSEERSGTPITGRSVCAASTPGRAAARPAPAMSTCSPRPLAVRPYSATASGCLCAERTSNSCAIPRASSSSIAACMRSRSDSEPTTMPTRGLDMCHGRDVLAIAHVGKGDAIARAIGKLARSNDAVADARHVENPAAVRDEAIALARRSCVKDERSFLFGFGDTLDRGADIVAGGIFPAREHDGDGGSVRNCEVGARQIARRRGGEDLEKVSFEARQERLRLGIAEPTVELEHPWPIGRDHEPCEEDADKRRATLGELGEHRSVDRVEQLLDLCRAEPGDRGVRAHPAGVRSLVALVCALEVLDDRQRERSHTVAQCEDGDLLAFEELLDHDRVAEGGGRDKGAVELRLIAADEHAFARREAVGLDHAGRSRNRERVGRGHARVTHDVLGERLRAFDPRRLTARAEDPDAGMPELVGNAGDEGRFRTDHDEVGIECSGEVKEPLAILRVNGVALAEG